MDIKHSDIIAVTNRRLCVRPFLEQIERVCIFRPKAVIIREKDMEEEEYERLALEVSEICRRYEVKCIPHSFINAAVRLSTDAIHLPVRSLEENKSRLKDFKLIGASVHSVEEAIRAEELGAAYITAGHIYETDCKKGVPPRGLDFLREVCAAVNIPVYAIGGIKIDAGQLKELKDCGAAGGCIMSGMMRL